LFQEVAEKFIPAEASGRKENLYSDRIYRIFRIIVFEMQRLNILLIVPAPLNSRCRRDDSTGVNPV
jgi:hypothetical protein